MGEKRCATMLKQIEGPSSVEENPFRLFFPQRLFSDKYGGEKIGHNIKSLVKNSWFSSLILNLLGNRVHNILINLPIILQNQTLTDQFSRIQYKFQNQARPWNPLVCHMFTYGLCYTLSVKYYYMHILRWYRYFGERQILTAFLSSVMSIIAYSIMGYISRGRLVLVKCNTAT